MTDWRSKGKVEYRAIRLRGRWTPFIVSLFLTPVALVIGFVSASAGHGNYFLAKILFPYTMLSTVFFDSVTNSFLIVAAAQLPIYGVILSLVGERKYALFRIDRNSYLICNLMLRPHP